MDPKKFKDEVWVLKDKGKSVEVKGKWSKKSKRFKKMIFTIGEEEYKLRIDEIRSILYFLSDEDERMKLMDLKENKAANFDYHVEIEATKDIKKGETISASLKLQVSDFRLRAILEAMLSMYTKEQVLEVIKNVEVK